MLTKESTNIWGWSSVPKCFIFFFRYLILEFFSIWASTPAKSKAAGNIERSLTTHNIDQQKSLKFLFLQFSERSILNSWLEWMCKKERERISEWCSTRGYFRQQSCHTMCTVLKNKNNKCIYFFIALSVYPLYSIILIQLYVRTIYVDHSLQSL